MTTVVFWDFHGTLTYDRYGWSGTMLRILEEHRPGHAVKRKTLSHLLCTGFPWHSPEKGHTQYNDDPEGWWRASDAQMTRIYNTVGVPVEEARRLAGLFRETYFCSDNFIPYDDTMDALAVCRARGYRNVILSNHVPELDEILAGLPFAALIDGTVNSARVGYEKPHPMIFTHARRIAGDPDICWMVGDNYTADCMGGLAAGFAPIWVHHEGHAPDDWDPRVRKAETLMDVIEIITEETCDGQE